jgi:hypothetical protein
VPYIAIRKDFKFDHRCPKCGIPLTTNTGYLLRDENGDEDYYGETCAKNLTGADLRGVPDLTKALLAASGGSRPTGRSRAGGVRNARDDLERAARYVLLRQRQLSHIPTIAFRGRPNSRVISRQIVDGCWSGGGTGSPIGRKRPQLLRVIRLLPAV